MNTPKKLQVSCTHEDYSHCAYWNHWTCQNPLCAVPVPVAMYPGVRPSGCPITDEWNRKEVQTHEHRTKQSR